MSRPRSAGEGGAAGPCAAPFAVARWPGRARAGRAGRERLFVLALLCAAASPAPALTLEEALAEAARSNPTLEAAREAARATHELLPLARSDWLPNVDLSVSGRRSRTWPGPLDDARDTSGQVSWELGYTQNLYRSGGSTATLRQSEATVRQAHALVEDTEQGVFLSVVTAYLDVVRAERVLGLRAASLDFFEERVRETEALFRVGDRTRADVAQTHAEREVAAADVLSASAELEIQRAAFETLVGAPPQDLEAVDEPAGLPESLEAASKSASSERPAVRAARHAMEGARHAVRVAASELGPRVDLRGTLTRTLPQPPDDLFAYNRSQAAVGLQLSMPLYRAGAGGARLREAQKVLAQRRNEWAAATREAVQRATSAWRRLEAARQRQSALEAAVVASKTALAGIRSQAEVGERTVREVLDAERNLVGQQVRALSEERNALVEAYRLLEAIGALTARRLGQAGVATLENEARRTRRNLAPGLLSLPLFGGAQDSS